MKKVMEKKFVLLNYFGNVNEDLLNPNARDNSTEPFIQLKDEIIKLGYKFEQAKEQSINDCSVILFWGVFQNLYLINLKRKLRNFFTSQNNHINRNWLKEAQINGKTNCPVLVLWEGKAVCPQNFEKKNYKYFSKILTWDDSIVDGIKIHKFCLPIPVNIPKVKEINYSEKKLLVNISSNKFSNYTHELYSERVKSIRYFEKEKKNDFDLFGYGWSDSENKSKPYPSYQGTVKNKWEVFPNYKFALCYENNCDQLGNITEKIFDCLRADCVPIYWGAPNINDYVDPRCFIDRRNFKSNYELDKYISGISEAQYIEYRKAAKVYLETEQFKQLLTPSFVKRFVHVLEL